MCIIYKKAIIFKITKFVMYLSNNHVLHSCAPVRDVINETFAIKHSIMEIHMYVRMYLPFTVV